MPIEAKSFPAAAPARKYLLSKSQSASCHILGKRDERLSTMTYVWTIPSDRADLEKDLEALEELRVKELAFLVVDLERYKTVVDLFKEPDYVVEMTAERYLREEKRELYASIRRSMTVIEERLASMKKPSRPARSLVTTE